MSICYLHERKSNHNQPLLAQRVVKIMKVKLQKVSESPRSSVSQWPSQYLKLGILAVSLALLALFFFWPGMCLNQTEVSE